jgi:hypothetical protein
MARDRRARIDLVASVAAEYGAPSERTVEMTAAWGRLRNSTSSSGSGARGIREV